MVNQCLQLAATLVAPHTGPAGHTGALDCRSLSFPKGKSATHFWYISSRSFS